MNKLTLHFRCTDCNGFPQAKIILDNELICDHNFLCDQETIVLNIDTSPGDHCLIVERHSKKNDNFIFVNGKIIKDQILEIIKLSVDNIAIPMHIVDSNCKFSYHDRVDVGSRYFGPNGIWSFTFSTPLIQHILDLRIVHESKYNQDYQFPWSYKHGPTTAQKIITTIENLEKKIDQIL